jgi:hypothetical protein
MIWKTEISPLLKDFELMRQPVIIRVNKFDESLMKRQLKILPAGWLRLTAQGKK